MRDKIEASVRDLLLELGINGDKLDPQANFHDLELDSTEMVLLVVQIKGRWRVAITTNDALRLTTMADMVDLVAERIAMRDGG